MIGKSETTERAIEAEQSVIGAMLMDESCIPDVLVEVRPEDFQVETNRDIFTAISDLRKRGERADLVTVLAAMRAAGTYGDGTREHILKIADITPTSAGAVDYAKIVRDNGIRYRTRKELSRLLFDNALTGQQLLAEAHDSITKLSETATNTDIISMDSMTNNFFAALEARQEGKRNAVSTGFKGLDELLSGGLLKRGLYILAGRPGMGKTSMALNIASQAKGSVLYITLEMDEEQLVPRLYAAMTGISSNRLLTANNLTDDEFGEVVEASTKIKKDFFINGLPQMDVERIGSLARSVKNLTLVVIDYMGLIHSDDKNRYSRISDISADLKMLARRLNVPILCLAQLSRAVEGRDDKRPQLADLRDSGSIEQDADGVLFVYRPDYYQGQAKKAWEPSFVECILAKHRHGRTGSVGFTAYLANNKFLEVS